MALTTITRHGGSSHYVRVDSAIKTSVTPSIFGYDPTSDVQQVAFEMTQPQMAVAQFMGLGAGLSLWQKVKIKYAAAKSRRAINKMIKAAGVNGLRGFGDAQAGFVDEAQGWGAGVAQSRQESMAARIQAGGMPSQNPMQRQAQAGGAGDIYQRLAMQAITGLPAGTPNSIRARAYANSINVFQSPTTWKIGR